MGQPEPNAEYLEKILRKQSDRHIVLTSLKQEYELNHRRSEIAALPFDQLLEQLSTKNLTAVEVLSACIAKSLKINDATNCITEFIPGALQTAIDLDQKVSSGESLGPLHGIPVAIKDDFNVKDLDTTLGFAKNLYKPAKESATLVTSLMKLGAVPFCKTNLPQSTLSIGSDNPIFGETLHGTHHTMTPGGSSSGSCALVAAGGCHIATGSDMGGSLRIPAHYHGICSLKGTMNRLSSQGLVPCLPLLETQTSAPGIITKDPKTLAFVWKCLLQENLQNELDPCAVPVSWNEQLFSGRNKLRIGYLTSLPFFPAFPCTMKTVLKAKDALINEGHTVVPFQLPEKSVFQTIINNLEMGDKQGWWNKTFEGEIVGKCMEGFVKDFTTKQSGREDDSIRFGVSSGNGVASLLDCVQQKENIRHDILARMDHAGVDLIMTPAFPHPATRLEDSMASSGASVYMYTRLWNYLDFPAGVVPFGFEVELRDKSFPEELKNSQWEPAVRHSVGMPINVQIIGKPFKEELVLKALLELQCLYENNISSLNVVGK